MTETHETRAPTPRELQALIEAERIGLPFVHWRDGSGAQQILTLGHDVTRATVGRREQSQVPLAWDPEVSRAHAYFESVGEEWTLVDDGLSRNGSFVNGSRVLGRQRLHDRDRLCFGNTNVVYREPLGAEAGDTTTRAPRNAELDAPVRDPAQGADGALPPAERLDYLRLDTGEESTDRPGALST